MRRREFVIGSAATLAMPLAAGAKTATKMKRLAMVHASEKIANMTSNGRPATERFSKSLVAWVALKTEICRWSGLLAKVAKISMRRWRERLSLQLRMQYFLCTLGLRFLSHPSLRQFRSLRLTAIRLR
jgi:hypothetical protein